MFGFGSKVATGEMSQEELDANGRQEWPLHYAIAEAFGGTVKPFDQYQGPYVLIGSEARGSGVYAPATPMAGTVRLWLSSDDGMMGIVYNEENEKQSQPFLLNGSNAEQDAIAAAEEVLSGGNEEQEREVNSDIQGHESSAADEKESSGNDDFWMSGVKASLLNNPMQSKNARLLRKTASGTMLIRDDHPSPNSKLQQIMGDPLDQPYTAFVQFHSNPGTMQIPNPLSPIEGDEAFFAYLIPGAVFQSHDGQQWVIDNYNAGAYGVELYNRWYPRQRAFVNIDDVRRSIHSYVEPVQATIPPPPPGVSYIGQPVRIVDGKSHT
jgi:hypothetical protein